MDIQEGTIGSKGKYELDLVSGKFILKGDYKEGLIEHAQCTKFDVVGALTLLKEKIGGKFDDALIDFTNAAILAASAPADGEVAVPKLEGN